MNFNDIMALGGKRCACGKVHNVTTQKITVGSGAINTLSDMVKSFGAKRAFVFSDVNTFCAAGESALLMLNGAGIEYKSYVISDEHLMPDERSVGSVVMHYDPSSDIIIGVGSGVINDIGKILSNVTGKPYIIVATAPSMDGYVSNTSAMDRDGLKISIQSRCPDGIIGDTDIMKKAPARMLAAGLGDMLAKYVSITEWRISHIINGEYYCETVASLVREALDRCVSNVDGLFRREDKAVEAVFYGLLISGIAMSYAGISRPASGMEHYISHIMDMRHLEFGTPISLHGIQCGVGTLTVTRLYEKLKGFTPDREKALRYVEKFDYNEWTDTLHSLVGKAADVTISNEKVEQKYSMERHSARIDRIISNWHAVLRVIDEELPSSARIEDILNRCGAPATLDELEFPSELRKTLLKATKDVRDKYILSHLVWDLGIVDEMYS